MFIETLFTIDKTLKQPKCPLMDEWIKKMWYIHKMEYYSAIKRIEIMPFTATWMQLINIKVTCKAFHGLTSIHLIRLAFPNSSKGT